MNLKAALDAVAPVVGDGKVVPIYAFVKWHGSTLYGTDGRQAITVQVDEECSSLTPVLVRHDAFVRAMKSDAPSVEVHEKNVVVKSGRSRTTLRRCFDEMPMLFPSRTSNDFFALSSNVLKQLLGSVGGKDAVVWTQGVHVTPDFVFAANHLAAVRHVHSAKMTGLITIPRWVATYLGNVGGDILMGSTPNSHLTFLLEDAVLDSALLSQEPSKQIVTMMSKLTDVETPVPEGMEEAIRRIKDHGATSFLAGEGTIRYESEDLEIVEEVDIQGPKRRWGVEPALTALRLATHIDLTGEHARWSGNGFQGIFAGMST